MLGQKICSINTRLIDVQGGKGSGTEGANYRSF